LNTIYIDMNPRKLKVGGLTINEVQAELFPPKPKCALHDGEGNHCPFPPKHLVKDAKRG